MKKVLLYIARGFLSLLFIFAGVGKLLDWQGTVDALSMTFSNWSMHLEGTIVSANAHEFLVASSATLLGIATFLEIIGALLILIGYKVRWGAFFLLLFLVPVTLVFHPFWFEIGTDLHKELSVFLKNLALIGALLYILLTPEKAPKAHPTSLS